MQIPSELQPQRELDLALAVRRFGDGSGRAGVLRWIRGIEHHIPRDRTVEVRVIEDVEGLGPELQIQSFSQRNRLNNDMSKFQNPGPVNLPRATLRRYRPTAAGRHWDRNTGLFS